MKRNYYRHFMSSFQIPASPIKQLDFTIIRMIIESIFNTNNVFYKVYANATFSECRAVQIMPHLSDQMTGYIAFADGDYGTIHTV